MVVFATGMIQVWFGDCDNDDLLLLVWKVSESQIALKNVFQLKYSAVGYGLPSYGAL